MEQATNREIGGSHLQGYTISTFQNIVDKLGKPHSNGDAYKVDAEWAFKFEDGTVATLYNWKNGKNYCGANGLNVEDITEWNIGGFSPDAVDKIEEALK
jgi:hypothetical protein